MKNGRRRKEESGGATTVQTSAPTSRRDQLVDTYRQLGGTGNAEHYALPVLEKAVATAYENNEKQYGLGNLLNRVAEGNGLIQSFTDTINAYNARQNASNAYKEIKANQVQNTLDRLGQTSQARTSNDSLTEDVKRTGGSLNPYDYDSVGDYLLNSPISPISAITNNIQDAQNGKGGILANLATMGNPIASSKPKTTLTPEMQRAGLTEKDLEIWNNAQNNEERKAILADWATTHPVLATLNSIPSNLLESVESTAQQAQDYGNGKALEERPTSADIVRQTVGQNINVDSPELLENLGLTDEKATNLARLGYSGANSIADMILASLTGAPKVSAGVMGAEKANQTINDAISRGLNPTQIASEGVASGIATALTEAIPFERFKNGGNILGSMLAEGLQEGSEDIVDTFFDELITKVGGNYDKSALRQEYLAYINAGYSPEEAEQAVKDNYKKQVATDAILGGITGGLMQGGTNLVNGTNFFSGKPRNGQTNEQTEAKEIPTVQPEVAEEVAEEIEETEPIPAVNQTEAREEEQQNIPSLNREQLEAEKKRIADVLSQNVNGDAPVRDIDVNMYKQYADSYNAMLREYGQTDSAIGIADDINTAYNNIVSAENGTQQQEAIERFNYLIQLANDTLANGNNNLPTNQPTQNIPSLDSVLSRAASEVNTFLNGYESNVLGKEDARELGQRLLALGNQYPEARNEINNLWKSVTRVVNGQTEQTVQPEVSGRDLIQQSRDARNLINRAEQYKAKLSSFGNKTFNKRLDNAINAVREGKTNAVENLNTLLAQIDERMNGETIGVSERAINQDMYDQMKNATDGRVIHISPETLKAMDMSVTELNELISTGTGRLRFKLDGGAPIDEAYNEIYGLANGMLPEPRSMGESDMVDALVKYMTDAKSGKDSLVNETSWNDTPLEETRSSAVVEAQNVSDTFLDNILDGKYKTKEEAQKAWSDYINQLTELGRKYPEARATIGDIAEQTSIDYRRSRLDSDIREAQNANDINKALLRMNLGFFGGTDEDVDTDYVNKAQTGNFKESDVYNNTGKNSGIMTDREIEQHEKDNNMLYESIDEESSIKQAYKSLKERGKTPERNRLLKSDDWTNSDVDEAFILWQIAVDEATAIDERGGDSTKAWQEASKFFEKIKDIGSGKGQSLQAFAKWSRNNTAEGLLSHAATVIKTAKNGQRAAQNNWDSQIAKLTKDAHEMDADFMKQFLTEAKKIEGLDLNSREARHIMANLGRMINQQMPPNLAEKLTTFLMDNMLGNVRTLITRNAGGNIGFNLMEEFLRRPLSALIDSKLSQARGTNRTISGLTKEGWNAWKEGFKEGFKQEIYDFQNDIQSARSGENTLETATANNRDVFNNKLLAKYNKLVKAGLSIGDRPFYEATYKQSLVEYNKLYNEGKIKGLDGKPLPKEEFQKLAEMHAKLNALAAVYQDDSAMAQAFVGMKQAISKMSEGLVGSDILSQFSMPFVKTPANIIERSIEYSPLGLAKNLVQTLREVKSDKIDFNQERFATELSRNIIGTGLFALGLYMANAGALTGAYSEDKDMKQAQKEAGMQEFALHTGIGDFDLSWIPVLGNNLVSAASAYDSYNRPDVEGSQALGNGITAGVKSQFDTSALQGLQRLVGGSGSGYNSDTDIVTNAKNTLLSGGTQFVPSLLRQAAAFTDENQRQLSGPNENDYYINSVLNSIPGLRETLEPKIGRTGEELEQNVGQGTLGKFLTNFISPATWTQGTADPVRDEAMRLFEATGNNIAFQPSVSIKELKTEDHVPTAEEFTEYQRNAYTAMNQIAQQVINSDYYASLTDGEKESTLDDIYKAVKAVEKANILGTDKSNLSGASKAYDEGGADGLTDYVIARAYLNQLGASNNPENRETVLGMVQNGEMESTLALSNELQQAGLTGSLNETYKYDHAAQYIPTLTPTQFAQTYTAINANGNTSISQDEIISYLNQNPSAYSDEDAMQLWNAYGSSSWAYIPVLNNDGTWHKKKGSSSSTQTSSATPVTPASIGQYGRGNIDLYNRPQFIQPDGSISTVNSYGFGEDGKEILVPTIAYDRNGKPYQMTNQEAMDRYHQTGEYLGKFDTVEELEAYAQALHLQQEMLYR